MQAYKFETEVLPTGMIPLPKNYYHLKSHQVEIIIIDKKEYVPKKDSFQSDKLFWESFGSWDDDRTTEEIIKNIYQSRQSSKKEITL